MKKIYYSVIFSLAFSLFSCSDFLDRESLSELSNGNFWNTEADATKALVGCYDALQSEGSLGFCWPGTRLVVCANWNLLRIMVILLGFRGLDPMLLLITP